jgi:hypothetical protein
VGRDHEEQQEKIRARRAGSRKQRQEEGIKGSNVSGGKEQDLPSRFGIPRKMGFCRNCKGRRERVREKKGRKKERKKMGRT